MAGRKAAGVILSLMGSLLLLLIAAACMAVFVPRAFGWEPYTVVSGSMEPSIPVGSMAYVVKTDPGLINDGEVIAFFDDLGNTVVHRAVRNRMVEGEIVTKGDANDANDMKPVPWDRVIGRVSIVVPYLGTWAAAVAGMPGKLWTMCVAIGGAVLNVAGARLRKGRVPDGEDA